LRNQKQADCRVVEHGEETQSHVGSEVEGDKGRFYGDRVITIARSKFNSHTRRVYVVASLDKTL